LTGNGKVNKKALTAIAAELEVVEDAVDKPSTPTERRLAAMWAEVLGISDDGIGRWDDFFDLGGTSLSGLKLAIALNRALSLRDLATHSVLAHQAALVDLRYEGIDEVGDARAALSDGPSGRCGVAAPRGAREGTEAR